MSQEKYIICPFFKSQSSVAIRCEDISENKLSGICFGSSWEKTIYMRSYCMSFDYEKKCEVCSRILEKYNKAEAVKPREMLVISWKGEEACQDH